MLDRTPRRSGMLAGHFEYAVRAGVIGPKCVRVARTEKWSESYWLSFWTGNPHALFGQKVNFLS
jgi:hypothetical protein